MPHWTVVELEYGDGRIYGPRSLLGVVARTTILYYHEEGPFFQVNEKHNTCAPP